MTYIMALNFLPNIVPIPKNSRVILVQVFRLSTVANGKKIATIGFTLSRNVDFLWDQ